MRRSGWGRGAATAAAVVLAMGLAGCAGSGGGGEGQGKSSEGLGSADSSGAVAALPDALKGPKIGQQAEEREVVYTGTVRVRVGDAEDAAERAQAIADAADGYLASQNADLEGDQEVVLSLRVPAGRFDEVVADLADLGTVQTRDVSSEDVTDQVVDLEGRLQNARTSAERLRELLAKAENIANITTLEDKLTQRETEIEGLSGQLEVLQDRAALSTIDVTFTEQAEQTVSDDLPGPLDALRSGAITLVNVLLVVVAVVAFLLPFAPFVVLGWWLRRRVKRWRALHPKAPPAGVGPWGTSVAGWPGNPPPPDPVPVAPAAPAPAAITDPDPDEGT